MRSIAERHLYIIEQLKKQQYIKVTEIAKELDVTTVTIRKDLKALEERNLLFRTPNQQKKNNLLNPTIKIFRRKFIQIFEKKNQEISAAFYFVNTVFYNKFNQFLKTHL